MTDKEYAGGLQAHYRALIMSCSCGVGPNEWESYEHRVKYKLCVDCQKLRELEKKYKGQEVLNGEVYYSPYMFTLPEVIDAIKETGDYEGLMLHLREKCNWMFAEPTLERFVNTLHNADLLKEAHMSYLNRNKEG